jgi:hypothetical protein
MASACSTHATARITKMRQRRVVAYHASSSRLATYVASSSNSSS